MNENETETQWESRFDGEDREIANMDEYDYWTLLKRTDSLALG